MSKTTTRNGVEFRSCGCGCEAPVAGKAAYRPGHDARHASDIGKEIAVTGDRSKADALPSPALRAKALRIADNASAKAAGKAQSQAARNAAKRAASPAVAETKADAFLKTHTQGEVKIGRWTYPVRVTNAGKVEVNEKRDGSGSWGALQPGQASKIVWTD